MNHLVEAWVACAVSLSAACYVSESDGWMNFMFEHGFDCVVMSSASGCVQVPEEAACMSVVQSLQSACNSGDATVEIPPVRKQCAARVGYGLLLTLSDACGEADDA
jgi:hypothetical protein